MAVTNDQKKTKKNWEKKMEKQDKMTMAASVAAWLGSACSVSELQCVES